MLNLSEVQQRFGNLTTFKWGRLPPILEYGEPYELKGNSGNSFIFRISPTFVEISENADKLQYLLQGSLDGGQLSWCIWTRDTKQKSLTYHPDMPRSTASIFYDDVFNFFSQYNLLPINTIVGWWLEGDNLQAYLDHLKSGCSENEAALKTWSGKKAAERGFTKAVLFQKKPDVIYHFKKPI